MPPPARRYAEDTKVPVERSRTEIMTLLTRHGATAFGFVSQGDNQVIVFEIAQRRVLMRLPLPARNERRFTHNASDFRRTPAQADQAWRQGERAAWRALVLIVKAKLEAVAAGITTIEREFLPDIALPNGQTVGEFVQPQLDKVYSSGEMPALLPGRHDD